MRVAAPHLVVDSIVKFDEGVRKRAGRLVTVREARAGSADWRWHGGARWLWPATGEAAAHRLALRKTKATYSPDYHPSSAVASH